MKTINDLIKEYWDLYNSHYIPIDKNDPNKGLKFAHATARDNLKDFFKQAIQESFKEIMPEREKGDSPRDWLLIEGWNDCLDKLQDNINKFMDEG